MINPFKIATSKKPTSENARHARRASVRRKKSISFAILIATLLFLFVGLLSWRTIKNLFLNKNETNTNGMKVVTLIFSIIYFGLSAAMSIIADSNLSGNLLAVMQFKTGIGPVLAFVFSIVLVRTIKKNVEDDARWEYDNPDTSYAPYVVGYRSNKK